jgi:hypothetical protein
MDVSQARTLTNRIYKRLNARRPKVDEFEKYYGGDQPLTFATDEWKAANASRYSDFSDNWCGTVVNAEAERLKPIGLTNLGKKAGSRLWDQLQMNEFDAQFSQGAVTALTAGRAFVIVWDDGNGESLVTFEHPSNVEIEYDWENPRLRKAALKTWVDESTEYATLYTADQLFKWKRDRAAEPNERDSQAEQAQADAAIDGGWVPRFESDSEWIIENPLGVVPVVEISNRPTLKGDPISEISGVVPMQNAINLLWAYLFLAADYASMDARVMLATSPPKIPILDKDGKVIGDRPVEMKDLREKRLITLTGDNARIDSWKAAQLDIFTNTIEVAVGHIAAQTRTPPHYLVSNKGLSNLSGDALVAAEIGLVQKSNEFITFTDPQLREVIRLVALVKDERKLADKARLAGITWQDREKRSESQLADALLKKSQMGYPFEYLLEEAGKSPTEIERIMTMRKAEMDEALAAGVQDAVQGAMTDVESEPDGVGASEPA